MSGKSGRNELHRQNEEHFSVWAHIVKGRPPAGGQCPGFVTYRLLSVTLGKFINLYMVSPLPDGDNNSTYLRVVVKIEYIL